VFPVRYVLDCYILFGSAVFKGLMKLYNEVNVTKVCRHILVLVKI
jgi:hypothetical protein